jgi:hypothetical protein
LRERPKSGEFNLEIYFPEYTFCSIETFKYTKIQIITVGIDMIDKRGGDGMERELVWDTTTGKPPRKGERISNIEGEWEVTERRGSKIKIRKVEK